MREFEGNSSLFDTDLYEKYDLVIPIEIKKEKVVRHFLIGIIGSIIILLLNLLHVETGVKIFSYLEVFVTLLVAIYATIVFKFWSEDIKNPLKEANENFHRCYYALNDLCGYYKELSENQDEERFYLETKLEGYTQFELSFLFRKCTKHRRIIYAYTLPYLPYAIIAFMQALDFASNSPMV